MKGYKHPLSACQYCGDQVADTALKRHELGCKDIGPELRERNRTARLKERAKRARAEAKALRERIREPLKLEANANGYHKPLTTNGPRLSLTLSVDFDSLRALLFELGPALSIDRVEVK